jgi:hypothetical protein
MPTNNNVPAPEHRYESGSHGFVITGDTLILSDDKDCPPIAREDVTTIVVESTPIPDSQFGPWLTMVTCLLTSGTWASVCIYSPPDRIKVALHMAGWPVFGIAQYAPASLYQSIASNGLRGDFL